MSLLAQLQAFLREPSTGLLAENASISYVPTLTTISEPTAIIRHLQAQGRQLNKKAERVLDAIEGPTGVYLDTETVLEFVTGGGAYLPGLDDNFLADKIATLPISYAVHFDGAGKIAKMRVYWDQGSLLKQLEVIGARGRNWPIRDGKDQARLIASHSTTPQEQPAVMGLATRRSTASDRNDVHCARGSGSGTSATKDPHASLDLFAPRQVEEKNIYSPGSGDYVAPRVSAKPVMRDLTEILSGEQDSPSSSSSLLTNGTSPGSPTKKRGDGDKSHARIGASKHFQPMRLFDEGSDPESTPRPAAIEASGKHYNHFEFGDGEDAPPSTAGSDRKTKHSSQWGFDDFYTPNVRETKVHKLDQRTISWSDDEDAQPSPVLRPVVHRPRPDANPHFDLAVDGTPAGSGTGQAAQPTTSKGRMHNAGLSLYKDHILGDDDAHDPEFNKQPLSTVTNVSNARRGKDFGAHFELKDHSSPPPPPPPNKSSGAADADVDDGVGKENDGAKPAAISEDRKKVLQGMDAHWGLYDDGAAADAEPNEHKGIKTAGNGMGGRNTALHWGFGYPDDEPAAKAGAARNAQAKAADQKGFWDF